MSTRIEIIEKIKSSTEDAIISASIVAYDSDRSIDDLTGRDFVTKDMVIGVTPTIPDFEDIIESGTDNPKNYLVSALIGITSKRPIVFQTIPQIDPTTGLPLANKWTTIGASTVVNYNDDTDGNLISIDVFGNDDGSNKFSQDTMIRIS